MGVEEALSRPAVDIGAVPITETRVSTPMTGAIAGSADAAVAERIAAGPTQRLFRHVQDALAAGEIAPESLPGILERHGVTAADFARDYAQTVSDSGRTLGQLSYLRQRLGVVLANEPEAAQVLAALPDPPVSGLVQGDGLVSHGGRSAARPAGQPVGHLGAQRGTPRPGASGSIAWTAP